MSWKLHRMRMGETKKQLKQMLAPNKWVEIYVCCASYERCDRLVTLLLRHLDLYNDELITFYLFCLKVFTNLLNRIFFLAICMCVHVLFVCVCVALMYSIFLSLSEGGRWVWSYTLPLQRMFSLSLSVSRLPSLSLLRYLARLFYHCVHSSVPPCLGLSVCLSVKPLHCFVFILFLCKSLTLQVSWLNTH